MRVLITTRGSAGHLNPLAPFGHACIEAGHEVLVAAQRQNQAHVERTGLPFAPVSDPPEEEWMPLMAQFAELDIDTANRIMLGKFFGGIDLRAELPNLRAIAEDWRPDLIVRESWEYGSTLVAELYEIPIVRVGLGLGDLEALSIEVAAPEVNEARATAGLSPDPDGDRLRGSPYFTMMPEALEDPAAELPARTHRFRFGASAECLPLPDWWHGNDDPVVYLTFGSVAAGPHLPFYPELYRGAIEALAPLQARVLVTIGDASRDVAELGEVPHNVHVETWVPHDDAASSAAVIVCHGGYGSTLGSLANGTPLVVLPLFSTDQWANAEAVARSGTGLSVADEQATRSALGLPEAKSIEGLHGAVARVLSDDSYRREAESIAAAMRALPPVEESVEVLEAIAATR